VAAGIVLAIATIKPQLVLLLLAWLAVWTSADWRRRYRWLVSFVISMTILCGSGELYLPHWIPGFWKAVRDYQNYTGSASVLDGLIGAPWSWIFELLALGAVLVACWRERQNSTNSKSFALMLSMALAATVLLVPISAQYNQVLLIPAVLLLVKDRWAIWEKSAVNRALLVTTAALIVWPWISSTILAALSFILPPESFERIWAAPIWTTLQTPVAVTALVLIHYYQRSFHAPA
jgi:multisubunit Na+/H+ antiporter MnhG subunit